MRVILDSRRKLLEKLIKQYDGIELQLRDCGLGEDY